MSNYIGWSKQDRWLMAFVWAFSILGLGWMVVELATVSAAEYEALPSQIQAQPAEYCIREWTIYDDGPDDQTQDGPNRNQIIGARYDFRPEAENVVAPNLHKLRQWGVFVYSESQAGTDILICVPADRNRALRPIELSALSTGFDDVVLAPGTFAEVIFELATVHADNTQTTRAASLRPTTQGSLTMYLGDSVLRSERFVLGEHRASNVVRGAYQETYRMIRAATLTGENPAGSHQRYLDFLAEQFETEDFEQFIPDDLPRVPRLPHGTTITDNFDGCAIGGSVLTDDCNNDWSVTSTSVDCPVEVQSGDDDYVEKAGGGDTCENFLVAGVATDDHSLEATFRFNTAIDSTMEHAIFARKACGNTTRTWYSYWEETSPTDEERIRERTEGTSVTLATETPPGKSADTDYVYKFVVNGSNFEGFVDAASTITASDATITGNLCAGLRLRSNNGGSGITTADDVTFEDEAAAAPRRIFIFWPF